MRDPKAAKHMLHDDLKMLARRRNSLELVDTRNFRDDVLLCALFTGKCVKLFKIRRSISEEITLRDGLSFLHDDLSDRRDWIFGIALGGFAATGRTLRRHLGYDHDHVLFTVAHNL